MAALAILSINFGDRVRTYRDRFTYETCWELIVSGERGHGSAAW